MVNKLKNTFSISMIAFALLATTSAAFAEDATTTASSTPSATVPNPYLSSAAVEARVRQYFADSAVMVSIAKCESGFRQFNSDGTPLDGGSGGMIGVFQIGRAVHDEYAKSIGLDINTLEGNLGYARYLYAKDGTDPWLSSFSCWNMKNTVEATAEAATSTGASASAAAVFASDLSLGTINQEVQSLQIILNHLGYIVADSGPGSPGQETTKYGLLTRDAVRKFQCAQKIACDGNEYTTGYGYVGKRTRTALLTFAGGAIGNTGVPTPPVAAPSAPTDSPDVLDLKNRISNLQKQLIDLQAQLKAKTGQ